MNNTHLIDILRYTGVQSESPSSELYDFLVWPEGGLVACRKMQHYIITYYLAIIM